MGKLKKFIFIIAALLVLMPVAIFAGPHLVDVARSLPNGGWDAYTSGTLSVGEIFDPKGNPFAHRFSDVKDIRGATYVIALSDSRNKYECDLRCDGTNDQVQMQAAIDACSAGGSVVILEGTANINDTINFIDPAYPDREGINFTGQGRSTILKATAGIAAATPLINLGDDTHAAIGVYLAHMNLDGNSKAGEIGIQIYDATHSILDNIVVTQFKHWGIDAQYNHSISMLDCWIDNCGLETEVPGVLPYVGGIKIGGRPATRDVAFNDLHIVNVIIENCYDGMWIIQGVADSIVDCTIAGNARHGIVLDRDGGVTKLPISTTIDGCTFELNNIGSFANTADIYGTGITFKTRITNCYFSDSNVTWAIRLGVGSYITDLYVGQNWFHNGTTVNLNTTSAVNCVVEGNRFCTPLTFGTPKSVAPLNLNQFKYDWDDGFQSLATGMSLYVPGMSEANVYELSEKFTFPGDNITIYGDGPGSVLKTANGLDDSLLFADAKSGLTIKDLAIDGNRDNNVTADPISLTACSDSLIDNVTIYDADDRCVLITGGSNITIQNSTFYNADEHAIRVGGTPVTDISILDNRIYDSQYGIAFVWGGSTQYRLQIRGNLLDTMTGNMFSATCTDSIIANNIFKDGDIEGIHLEAADDNLITGNIFRNVVTPIDIANANADRNQVIGNDWYGCTNDSTDSGTGTFITNNIDKNGVQWTVDDNPIAVEVWVTHDNPNPSLGTIPAGSYYMRAHLDITEEFDAGGNDDAITVGYDVDPDSLVTSIVIDGLTGVQPLTLGTDNGYISVARAAEVYYTYTGGDPTQGKALVKIEFQRVPTEPA